MPKIFTPEARDTIRRNLKDHGLKLLEHRSYGSISVDELAQGAGIAKGTFYNFYPSKEIFFSELIRDFMEKDRQALEALFAKPHGGREAVGAYLADRYLSGNSLYDYFTVEDMRKILRTFPTEGKNPDSTRFVNALLSLEAVSPGCRPEVLVNLLNVLAMTAAQLRSLQVGGREETLKVLIDTILDYLYGKKERTEEI